MTRFLATRLPMAVLASLVVPATALAQVPGLDKPAERLNLNDVVQVLVWVIKFGLAFAAAVSVIFVVVAGYQYVLSAGNPEKVEKAKMGLTWSIVGFILTISAYAIVLLLQATLGQKAGTRVDKYLGLPVPETPQDVLTSLIDLFLKFGAAVAVLFLILGGYRYVTSQGNQDLAEGAKKTIIYSVMGLIVAMVANLIFALIKQAVVN